MKVLLAGATGAVGRPLTRALIAAGHDVLAVARSDQAASTVTALGARPVRADAMDRDTLIRAVDSQSADAIINQLTALKKPKSRLTKDDPSTALRVHGTAHLLAAAEVLGATRFLTQSLVLGYGYLDHGARVLTENDPFGVKSGGVPDFVVNGLISTEQQCFAADHVDGIALRYGLFYGPGTWIGPTRGARPFPVPRGGGGVMSWIHVEDAAAATVSALERGHAGEAYNIVDDHPAPWGEVAAAATARGGRILRVPDRVLRLVPYLGALTLDTSIRVSHAKATGHLGWTPTYPTYREGLQPQ